jgi:hypothetical protein
MGVLYGWQVAMHLTLLANKENILRTSYTMIPLDAAASECPWSDKTMAQLIVTGLAAIRSD